MRTLEGHFPPTKAVMSTFMLACVPVMKTTTTTITTTAATPPVTPNPSALIVAMMSAKYCLVCKEQPCPFRLFNPFSIRMVRRRRLGQRQTERASEKEEIKKKEEERGIRQKDIDDHYPPSPIYIPSNKEDT